MAKDKLTDYSATAGSNTDIGGISISEGMLPSNVNNALREQMSHLADFAAGTSGVDVLKLQDDTDTNSIKIQAPASVTTSTTFTLPDGDGSANQSLVTNGSGTLSFSTRLANVVEDTTPQLGGDLDLNSNDITGTGDINITGTITADGLTVDGSGTAQITSTSGTTLELIRSGSAGQISSLIMKDGGNAQNRINSSGGALEFEYGASSLNAIKIDNNGDVSLYADDGTTQGFFWDASAESLGIGTSSPSSALHLSGASTADARQTFTQTTAGLSGQVQQGSTGFTLAALGNQNMIFDTNSTERMRIDSSGNVMVGGTTAGNASTVSLNVGDVGSTSGGLQLWGTTTGTHYVQFGDESGTAANHYRGYMAYAHNGDSLRFGTASTERMRIDSSGNVGIGTNSPSSASNNAENLVIYDGAGNSGVTIRTGAASGYSSIYFSDSASFTVGRIEYQHGGDDMLFYTNNTERMRITTDKVQFSVDAKVNADNTHDLGASGARWQDAYVAGGVTTTSDANEKQQIALLTDAEITAAKAISALFKTFKWNSAVDVKGEEARIHTGVMAQDIQEAMTDAGLDASKYAFWCSNTWWEANETYADDDGVEQTRTNIYETAEEAPEGAIERTRLGIRYHELMAFVGAATEQRLANIETRLAALEAN